jgi:hypothetical protein
MQFHDSQSNSISVFILCEEFKEEKNTVEIFQPILKFSTAAIFDRRKFREKSISMK